MRKFLLFFLAICSVVVANAITVTEGGITYSCVLSRIPGMYGRAAVVSGDACTGDVVIPKVILVQTSSDQFEQCAVISIGKEAFKGSAITAVKIPNTVTSIGDGAFAECANLKSITVPSSVQSLGVNSLNTGKEIDVTIESAALLKGEVNAVNKALYSKLGTLTLDADTVVMDYENKSDFSEHYITSVRKLVIGNNVRYVGRMSSLTHIDDLVIGGNVEDMSRSNFVEYWQKEMGQSSRIDTVTFVGNLVDDIFGGKDVYQAISPDVKVLRFAEGVTTISARLFRGYSYADKSVGVAKVILPSTLEKLDGVAFEGESHLVDVEIPENIKSIGQQVFSGTGISYVRVPGTMEELGSYAFENCKNLKTVIFDEGVQKIGPFSLNGCNSLNHLEIPSTVTLFATQNNLETKNLTYLKDLTVTNVNNCIFPDNMDCTIITATEDRADVYRAKGYKNVFSMEGLNLSKADVNRDGAVDSKDVKKVYEEILNQ